MNPTPAPIKRLMTIAIYLPLLFGTCYLAHGAFYEFDSNLSLILFDLFLVILVGELPREVLLDSSAVWTFKQHRPDIIAMAS
ncbi:MAG: hypothetical protein WC910_08230 [Bacteroidales bacterium]|jgi:hypothetical protein